MSLGNEGHIRGHPTVRPWAILHCSMGHMSSLTSPYDLLSLALDAGNGSFLDHVMTGANMRRAMRRVATNRGSAGVDGMSVQRLAVEWPQIGTRVAEQLRTGAYRPQPLLRVAVPKPGAGGWRVLGIPTVLDRVVQQAIAQPLSALLDPGFSPHSFGFRPGRCAHGALLQARRFICEDGLRWVLHLDLEKFFDCVPHDRLLAQLSAVVRDPRLLELIRRCIAAPFAGRHQPTARSKGLPQGSPLSPLLANFFLDWLDQRLFDAGFAFCRYADDICLYFGSRAEAREALAMIAPWIDGDLALRLNRDKTRIGPVDQDVFLGYRMQWTDGKVTFTPSAAAGHKLRRAVRRLLRNHRSANPRELIETAVMPVLKGWTAYFSLADNAVLFAGLDRWLVAELRRWLWARLRHPQRRARALKKRGTQRTSAWKLATESADAAIESETFQRAYSVGWLRARGWSPLHELGKRRACTPSGSADDPVFSLDSAHDLGIACRSAVRDLDLYSLRYESPE